jgi:hypothetical protein
MLMSWRAGDWDDQRRRANNERFRIVTVKSLVVLHVTDKALLVIEKETLEAMQAADQGIADFKKWVPLSQIRSPSIPLLEIDKDDEVDLGLPLWLVQEKGFLYE